MVTLPSDLVVQDGEQHFLKILGSHRAICKLVCPCTSKTIKNMSIAGSANLKTLLELLLKEFSPKQSQDTGPDLFDDKKEPQKVNKKRKLSAILPCTTKTVTLPNGKEACFMMSTLKSTPAVLLQEPDLANLVEYLAEDCDSCAKYAKPKN